MEPRVDYYPTHESHGFRIRRGRPLPFGPALVPNGVNFSVFSSSAVSCTLVLFQKHQPKPMVEIEFPQEFRTGDVYSMIVFDLDYEDLEYGYRFDGPWDPANGRRFDRAKILFDPYSKVLGGRDVWRREPDENDIYPYRSRLAFDDFDWENDRALETPLQDLVIYELHVRGFTAHPSSKVTAPGTFAGLREKIPYLKELGINCVELLPVFEFDEWENCRKHPETGEQLLNYWGYSTLAFFAPKAGYAATGRLGMQMDEFKATVKEFHRAGIEVILDVVFNHTAEGDQRGPTLCYRGIDNRTYYMLTPGGYYFNFSGCGNTFNCNHPVVRNLVLDCLRYWSAEYHIDGFRFDLASILDRDQNGIPLANPPLLELLAYDPVLSKCKLIAEAWDAGGLYQVGSFPAYGRWTEWNGKFRDCLRKFVKGDSGLVWEMGSRVQGSPDLYQMRGPSASVNFVTCHDGFTLYDTVSYSYKHNEANGENNRDGCDDNASWNWGCEGESTDGQIQSLRCRLMKNAFSLLLLSNGVPMILMGDEVGRTQRGNNNTYCHDSEVTWMDWTLLQQNAELLRFVRNLLMFRKTHAAFRTGTFFRHADYRGVGSPDISFHGTTPFSPDTSQSSRYIAWMLCGAYAHPAHEDIYIAVNSHWNSLPVRVPQSSNRTPWKVVVNTSMPSPEDIHDACSGPTIRGSDVIVGARSVMVLAAGLRAV
jgi:isoamylase